MNCAVLYVSIYNFICANYILQWYVVIIQLSKRYVESRRILCRDSQSIQLIPRGIHQFVVFISDHMHSCILLIRRHYFIDLIYHSRNIIKCWFNSNVKILLHRLYEPINDQLILINLLLHFFWNSIISCKLC